MQKSERYARIPVSVLYDTSLSVYARLVYAEIAMSVWQGTTAYIGQRLIAERLGISQSEVSKSVRSLVGSGHLEWMDNGRGRRAHMQLKSPLFGQKQGRRFEVGEGPSGGMRIVSLPSKDLRLSGAAAPSHIARPAPTKGTE